MKWTEVNALIPTLKEQPSDAEIISHTLMLRAGLIRKVAGGLYIYLPLCLRVLRKIENIIREEMNNKGAQELLMPLIQPRDLWEKSGRWFKMGKEMVRFKNRQDRDFVLGPTHEEVITDLISKEINSYRNIPCNFYQIQVKVRDEIRPRFGVIRAKEFVMKDAYSFHATEESLEKTYQDMYEAYSNMFKRVGLRVQVVEADAGIMGGSISAEFMALAASGEDYLVSCSCGYAANLEKAESIKEEVFLKEEEKNLEEVHTPDMRTIEEVSAFMKVSPDKMIKTLFYMADDGPVCVLVKGDDSVNETKLKHYLNTVDLFLLDEENICDITGAPVGFSGPIGLKKDIRMIADKNIFSVINGVTGANKKDKHIKNVNIKRDCLIEEIADIILAKENEICPRCKKGRLSLTNGIEIGHIFKLGDKYTEPMKANYLDSDGKEKLLIMGCYGIGVSRMIAAVIEQNHDDNGIIWPRSIAPFDICLIAVNTQDQAVQNLSNELYFKLNQDKKISVLFDDREERPGIKFKDADLIGIPLRIIISSKNLEKNILELKIRKTGQVIEVPYNGVVDENLIKQIYFIWDGI